MRRHLHHAATYGRGYNGREELERGTDLQSLMVLQGLISLTRGAVFSIAGQWEALYSIIEAHIVTHVRDLGRLRMPPPSRGARARPPAGLAEGPPTRRCRLPPPRTKVAVEVAGDSETERLCAVGGSSEERDAPLVHPFPRLLKPRGGGAVEGLVAQLVPV